MWTEAEVLGDEAEANNANEGSIIPAKTRSPGRPKGAKDTVARRARKVNDNGNHDHESAFSTASTASGASSPSPTPTEWEVVPDAAGIPFIGEWNRVLTGIDLATMVNAEDVECDMEAPCEYAEFAHSKSEIEQIEQAHCGFAPFA
eukprot:1681342-Rhodomonas_salina.1